VMMTAVLPFAEQSDGGQSVHFGHLHIHQGKIERLASQDVEDFTFGAVGDLGGFLRKTHFTFGLLALANFVLKLLRAFLDTIFEIVFGVLEGGIALLNFVQHVVERKDQRTDFVSAAKGERAVNNNLFRRRHSARSWQARDEADFAFLQGEPDDSTLLGEIVRFADGEDWGSTQGGRG